MIKIMLKDGKKLARRIEKLENGGETVIKRTVSDVNSRVAGWVNKGIKKHYGVDNVAVREAQGKPKRGKTSIQVTGTKIDELSLEYKGRRLTHTHFNMSPKSMPKKGQKRYVKIPGQITGSNSPFVMATPPEPYRIEATIIKGRRIKLPPGIFVTTGNGGSTLPFQRKGEKRHPIEAKRTVSVPQMIDNRAHDTIEQIINENVGKRFDNHMKQIMK